MVFSRFFLCNYHPLLDGLNWFVYRSDGFSVPALMVPLFSSVPSHHWTSLSLIRAWGHAWLGLQYFASDWFMPPLTRIWLANVRASSGFATAQSAAWDIAVTNPFTVAGCLSI